MQSACFWKDKVSLYESLFRGDHFPMMPEIVALWFFCKFRFSLIYSNYPTYSNYPALPYLVSGVKLNVSGHSFISDFMIRQKGKSKIVIFWNGSIRGLNGQLLEWEVLNINTYDVLLNQFFIFQISESERALRHFPPKAGVGSRTAGNFYSEWSRYTFRIWSRSRSHLKLSRLHIPADRRTSPLTE